jgi:hypothetical protein
MRRQIRYQAACAVLAVAGTGLMSTAAAASPTVVRHASPVSPVADSSAPRHDSGNVEVRVPPATISSSDGLGATVTAGASYEVVVPVWLAAGQPRTNAEIDVVGAKHALCRRTRLMPATITRMRCRVVPTATGVAIGLVVTVTIDVHNVAQPVVATFHHHVAKR